MIGNSLANQKSLYKKIAQIALQKKKVFHYEQETPDLVTFTEDVSNGKLHFFV